MCSLHGPVIAPEIMNCKSEEVLACSGESVSGEDRTASTAVAKAASATDLAALTAQCAAEATCVLVRLPC